MPRFTVANFDLADLVERATLDATGLERAGLHAQLDAGGGRLVRLIVVPTPRPRATITPELADLIERAAVDPFTVGAVATYGATFVVVPERIAKLLAGERGGKAS